VTHQRRYWPGEKVVQTEEEISINQIRSPCLVIAKWERISVLFLKKKSSEKVIVGGSISCRSHSQRPLS